MSGRYVRHEGVAVELGGGTPEAVADYFTKGHGTAVQGSTTDYGDQVWSTAPSGTSAVVDVNRLRFNGGSNDTVLLATLPGTDDDHRVRWSFSEASGAGYFYLVVRYTDVNNYVFVANSQVNPGNWTLYQVVGGSQTSIGSAGSIGWSAGIHYDIAAVGDQITLYRDGVSVLTATTDLETGTGFGVAVYKDGSGWWDNLSWAFIEVVE